MTNFFYDKEERKRVLGKPNTLQLFYKGEPPTLVRFTTQRFTIHRKSSNIAAPDTNPVRTPSEMSIGK